MKSQLLQLGSRLLLLVLLVATGCSGSEFQDGDFVPASRRAQFHAVSRRRCRRCRGDGSAAPSLRSGLLH